MHKIIFHKNMFRLGFFVALVAIEYLATTTIEISFVESMWDKSNHFIAFFVLYIMLSLGYPNLKIWQSFLLLLAFAIQIEVVQHFIEGRYASFLDIVADCIGIIIGILFCKIFKPFKYLV